MWVGSGARRDWEQNRRIRLTNRHRISGTTSIGTTRRMPTELGKSRGTSPRRHRRAETSDGCRSWEEELSSVGSASRDPDRLSIRTSKIRGGAVPVWRKVNCRLPRSSSLSRNSFLPFKLVPQTRMWTDVGARRQNRFCRSWYPFQINFFLALHVNIRCACALVVNNNSD